MNDKRRIELCNTALELNREFLTPDQYADIDGYINTYNEWGVGIEILIDLLGEEEEIKMSREQFTAIQVAMESMELGDSRRMEWLKKYSEII